MKTKFLFLTFLVAFIAGITLQAQSRKILVVYFSHSGNTREVARQIHDKVGGDIFELQVVKPYPTDYNAVVDQAKQELKAYYKPALKTRLNNIGQYTTVFIGYPNWWGTYPGPVRTFLAEYDLVGKTIIPFCTHEGSALGRSVDDLKKACPKSNFLQGLAITGSQVHRSQDKIDEWLRVIKITK